MKKQWNRKKGSRSGVTTLCQNCGKEVYSLPGKAKIGHGKYCSRSCRATANYPNNLKAFSGGEIAKNSGRMALRRFTEEVRKDETLHGKWAGDEVGYSALHQWLRRRYGDPCMCEVCGTCDPGRKYEWANISYEYRRDRSDFKRMCISCHRKYDKRSGTKNRKLEAAS